MSEAYTALIDRTRSWSEQAHAEGWLSESDVERLDKVEHRTPADLFVDRRQRPLVVAFFGGTGVGKSSLLNRLSGTRIARTGVERPTSREVTIYLHESVALSDLAGELPVAQVHVKRHDSDDRRDILWIDAPDIDSTEQENRQLALAWLPHVDLLVYVVSPERYRDDVGWRVLRQRGQRHGWMFVMNRWDEGDARQKQDFAAMLREAGFSDPLLFCTSCLGGGTQEAGDARDIAVLPTPDEFPKIETMIRVCLEQHGVRELERLGDRARLRELREELITARRRLGDAEQWQMIETASMRQWQRARAGFVEGLEWPIRAVAGRFAIRESGVVGQVVRQAVRAARANPETVSKAGPNALGAVRRQAGSGESLGLDTAELTRAVWDDWTRDKLVECVDAIEVEVRRSGVAAGPIRARLDQAARQAEAIVLRGVQEQLRLALARPGTLLQRGLRRVTGFLMTLLPMLALLWVAYNVFTGYYHASTGAGKYPGSDFAVSSILLVLVSWAVPFVCDRCLRPSLERTAMQAMRRGLAVGLDELGEQLQSAVDEPARAAQTRRKEADELVADISKLTLIPVAVGESSIARLLVHVS